MEKFLIIQTAFIGDVILATPIIEKIKQHFPDAQVDFLLRKGNESLLQDHPKISQLLVWNKKKKKTRNLFRLLAVIRNSKYDYIINIQRFTSTGILTAFSRAKQKIGFHNNPLAFLFSKKIKHQFEKGMHEINRNLQLIAHLTDQKPELPKLYPSSANYKAIEKYCNKQFICIAPTSVWFTKQFPPEKWIQFCNKVSHDYTIYLIGAPNDYEDCNNIKARTVHPNVQNIAGRLSLIESAALVEQAAMNFVNDSAPLHLCSAMNAPCTAIFCSTIPDFGFGPLSDQSFVIETIEELACRPCGIHGFKACPIDTFACAQSIEISELLKKIP